MPEQLLHRIEYQHGKPFKNPSVPALIGGGIRVGDELSQNWGWRDITGAPVVRGVGANDPPWAQVGGGGGPFRAFNFATNDEIWFSFHIPHDIVPNSDVHFHTHWMPDGVDTAAVRWEFTYAFAKGFGQEVFDIAGTTVTAEEAGPGVAYTHMVTESDAVTIPSLTEPDGIIYARIRRVPNGAIDNADSIFLLTADVHYQSTNMATEGKAPSFYRT